MLATILELVIFPTLLAYSDMENHSILLSLIFFVLTFIFFEIFIIHVPKEMEMLGQIDNRSSTDSSYSFCIDMRL